MKASDVIAELENIIKAPSRDQLLMTIELQEKLKAYRKQVAMPTVKPVSNVVVCWVCNDPKCDNPNGKH